MYEDDFDLYDFEIMIREFKQSILQNAKSDIQKKINDLENENKELKYKLSHLTELEKKANEKIHEANRKIADALIEAKKQRVIDLMKDIGEEAWKVNYKSEYTHDKCDKCDENRKIHFFSPKGKEYTEDCECAVIKTTYRPEKVYLGKLYLGKELKQANFYLAPKGYCESYDKAYLIGNNECYAYLRYNGQDFSKVDKYNTFFMNKDDCERYCEYLNNNIECKKDA